MPETWHIARGSRICAHGGGTIVPGEAFYSALIEDGEGFARRDFAAASWPEVDKAPFFSYWRNKSRSAGESDRAAAVDYGRLLVFFDALADAGEPRRRLFRYVVALMLARRRILRLDAVRKTPAGDFLVLHDRRRPEPLEVFAPEATREQLDEVQERLDRLFDDGDAEAGGAATEDGAGCGGRT